MTKNLSSCFAVGFEPIVIRKDMTHLVVIKESNLKFRIQNPGMRHGNVSVERYKISVDRYKTAV